MRVTAWGIPSRLPAHRRRAQDLFTGKPSAIAKPLFPGHSTHALAESNFLSIIHAHAGMFAGGGIKRGAVIGKTDALGGTVVESGWAQKRPIYMEDIACTIYSALGIDWTKTVEATPSRRTFHYVEPASGTKYMKFEPVRELFV